jgi:hypothetical protein
MKKTMKEIAKRFVIIPAKKITKKSEKLVQNPCSDSSCKEKKYNNKHTKKSNMKEGEREATEKIKLVKKNQWNFSKNNLKDTQGNTIDFETRIFILFVAVFDFFDVIFVCELVYRDVWGL